MCQVVLLRRSVLFHLSVVIFVAALLSTVQIMAASVGDELSKKVDDVNDIDEKRAKMTSSSSAAAAAAVAAEGNGATSSADNRIPTMIAEDLDSVSKQTTSGEVAATAISEQEAPLISSSSATPRARSARTRTEYSEGNKMAAPKYMLELYKKFSTDKYSHPMANIVRSFSNIVSNATSSGPVTTRTTYGNWTREHRLVFNVSSVSRDEDIYLAELRLLTLVETDRNMYDGINRRVSVFEVIDGGNDVSVFPENVGVDVRSETTIIVRDLVASKDFYGRESGWETFTVTDAVRRWIRSKSVLNTLEVRIETVGSRDDVDEQQQQPLVDIDTRPHNDNEPLLLIFSNDRRRRKFESRELHEMIEHEMDAVEDPAELDDDDADAEADYEEDETDENDDVEPGDDAADQRPSPSDDHLAAVSRIERDTEWVLTQSNAPSSRGQSADADYSSADADSEEWTKRKHRTLARDADLINGTEIHAAAANRDQMGTEAEDASPSAEHQRVRKRVRRARKRRTRRNICRRKPMYVNFEDIRWDQWIIEPKGYQAYECTGRCYFPLSDHLTPTKHAIVQTLLNTNHPRKASRTCCVPTRLDPISILYFDDQGTVTYKYKYDGMVVAECGCR